MKTVIRCLNVLYILITFIFMFFFLKGESNMVDMYTALVIAGRRTCNTENTKVTQVPTRYRNAVLENLTSLGLDADGNPIA